MKRGGGGGEQLAHALSAWPAPRLASAKGRGCGRPPHPGDRRRARKVKGAARGHRCARGGPPHIHPPLARNWALVPHCRCQPKVGRRTAPARGSTPANGGSTAPTGSLPTRTPSLAWTAWSGAGCWTRWGRYEGKKGDAFSLASAHDFEHTLLGETLIDRVCSNPAFEMFRDRFDIAREPLDYCTSDGIVDKFLMDGIAVDGTGKGIYE